MWTISSTLLLTCCLRAALAQNVWQDVIEFLTKGTKDECYMSVTGSGDLTKLRITCQGEERSYWCEYQGRPKVCRSYNGNPVHYYRQIMWSLRKLPNACQGQRVYKPLMCKRATDEAQMVFTTSSSADAVPRDRPEPMRPAQKPKPKPTRQQPLRTAPARPSQYKVVKVYPPRKVVTPRPTEPVPTTQVPLSEANRLARDYCWRSLHSACSFVIGLFRS